MAEGNPFTLSNVLARLEKFHGMILTPMVA